MAQLHVNAELCKGCGYCVMSCPKKALSLSGEMNKAGYDHVQCDHTKCICCGICYTVCPDMVFEITE